MLQTSAGHVRYALSSGQLGPLQSLEELGVCWGSGGRDLTLRSLRSGCSPVLDLRAKGCSIPIGIQRSWSAFFTLSAFFGFMANGRSWPNPGTGMISSTA